MKKTYELDFDRDFLSNIEKWGLNFYGRKRICVKTVVPEGEQRDLRTSRFGVIYADQPLTVWESQHPGTKKARTWEKEEFESLDELLKVWQVD